MTSILKKYNEVINKYFNKTSLDTFYDREVCDAVQFMESAFTKLQYAVFEYNGIRNMKEKQSKKFNKWRKEIVEKSTTKPFENVVINYVGNKLPFNIAIQKTLFAFYQYIHSVFDISGQFVNTALLGNQKLPMKDIYFKSFVQKKLARYTEYAGVQTYMESMINSLEFEFIEDFNNINKHQFQMECLVCTYIDEGYVDLKIGAFTKNGHTHSERDMIDAVEESLNFTLEYIDELMKLILRALIASNHNFANNRYQKVYIYIQIPNDTTQRGGYSYIKTNKPYQIGDTVRIMHIYKSISGDYTYKNIYEKTIFLKNSNNQFFAKAEIIGNIEGRNKIFELLEYREYKITQLGSMDKERALETFSRPKVLIGEPEVIA